MAFEEVRHRDPGWEAEQLQTVADAIRYLKEHKGESE